VSLFAWIVRALLLVCLLPVLLPLGRLTSTIFVSCLSVSLFLLVLAFLALGIVLGIALGVIGRLVDLVIVLGLIGLAWKWPRGIQATAAGKLRLAYRSLSNAICHQVRQCTAVDVALCLVVVLIALVLSLSSGLLHFLLTVIVVLAVIGIVWKWPRAPRLPFVKKLRLALDALWDDLRRRFR